MGLFPCTLKEFSFYFGGTSAIKTAIVLDVIHVEHSEQHPLEFRVADDTQLVVHHHWAIRCSSYECTVTCAA